MRMRASGPERAARTTNPSGSRSSLHRVAEHGAEPRTRGMLDRPVTGLLPGRAGRVRWMAPRHERGSRSGVNEGATPSGKAFMCSSRLPTAR
ncbi:hypothetical protein GCM10025868_45430 [Angustibacter aerolatus]|uniref:Uncharacterized protein n=1 Tax=Angustibacter aerolatus TaxID=1162965 RepID=A0ABQ6JM18_9ACTN|nr:hypothetical protein GCM10025868_45430 [Angustibacter aerolatus]